MPVIQVNLMRGRTDDQKKLLAQRITRGVVDAPGVKSDSVRVLMHETGPYDFVVGSVPMAEHPPASAA